MTLISSARRLLAHSTRSDEMRTLNRLIECAKPTIPYGIVSSADWPFAYHYPTPANNEHDHDVPQPAASCATVSVREESAHRGTMKLLDRNVDEEDTGLTSGGLTGGNARSNCIHTCSPFLSLPPCAESSAGKAVCGLA